jgi:hypothetical protein
VQHRTPSGKISYVEGGAIRSRFSSRRLVEWLALATSARRALGSETVHCAALLAHGRTESNATQDASVTAKPGMLAEFLDALDIDKVDSSGMRAAAGYCDTHDNSPPEAFNPFVEMVAAGGLKDTLTAMLDDKNIYRSAQALRPGYERPNEVTDETIDAYLTLQVSSGHCLRDLERFVGAFDNAHTVSLEAKQRDLNVPALMV